MWFWLLEWKWCLSLWVHCRNFVLWKRAVSCIFYLFNMTHEEGKGRASDRPSFFLGLWIYYLFCRMLCFFFQKHWECQLSIQAPWGGNKALIDSPLLFHELVFFKCRVIYLSRWLAHTFVNVWWRLIPVAGTFSSDNQSHGADCLNGLAIIAHRISRRMQQNSGEGHVFDHTLEYFSPLHTLSTEIRAPYQSQQAKLFCDV